MNMDAKTCVITGGTAGIGLATATALAGQGAEVVLLGRSRDRGKEALARIAATTGNDRGSMVQVDLADLDSVRNAAHEILDAHPRIHVLINNAGIMLPERQLTDDGVEKMFATNYLSHFLLTNLLLERLIASAPARIVSVGALIPRAVVDLDDLAMERRKYTPFTALGISKLAVVMFTRELARHLEGTGVTANALYPGVARTSIMDDQSWLSRTAMRLISGSPEKAARTSILLASDPSVDGVSGRMFSGGKETSMRGDQVNDPQQWRRLWDKSVQLTELEPSTGGKP
ncbi:SDR family NAD(P)-dependent oxidoreductase [Leucobacter allii]|uniref:SDR family NAD(P)-dependent oxidoreductase n=1 Tax=Leucobacter allii TaxID=2932247 RepID=A0ABY4FJS9_9MICO|nr:SDR family NAD(P)-dependent oxidoreductase [Leucobacter allii]UOQ56373.1 SDR family NAD(P)-dependent oxidoreductase [Leucobacter allii]